MNRATVFVVLLLAAAAHATSVVRMPLQHIADLSGQIVVGEIAGVESYWASNPRRIESRVTLRVESFLKGGDAAQRTLSFTVPGGAVGTWQARVAGAPEFHPGERWALCLLPTWKSFPTAGIHQGAFHLTKEGGVLDGRGQQVRALDDGGYIVIHGDGPTWTADAFVAALREIAERSRPVSLPRSGPVRVIPDYRPTSLKTAPSSPSGHTAPPDGVSIAPPPQREASP